MPPREEPAVSLGSHHLRWLPGAPDAGAMRPLLDTAQTAGLTGAWNRDPGSRTSASDGTQFTDAEDAVLTVSSHFEPGPGSGTSALVSQLSHNHSWLAGLRLFRLWILFMLLKMREALRALSLLWVVYMDIFCVRNQNSNLKISMYSFLNDLGKLITKNNIYL